MGRCHIGMDHGIAAIHYNFDDTPLVIEDCYDYSNVKYDESIGGYVRTDVPPKTEPATPPEMTPAHT